MNSKNLDAIKSMKVRLHSILETEKLSKVDAYEILCAEECLQEVIERNDVNSSTKNTQKIWINET